MDTHTVQFYESDAYLCNTVWDFVAEGLKAGEPAIVIATPEHRSDIEGRIPAEQLDNVTFVDAEEALATFMAGEMPDDSLFKEKIGSLVARISAGRERIRAFGEMVDVLWRANKPAAAIRLEELWNDLAREYPFGLLCAYGMNTFSSGSHHDTFRAICDHHAVVKPSESVTTPRDVALLQQQAMARATENAWLLSVAHESNRDKDHFLATLSHELRTPLTAILGWSRLLLTGALDPETMKTGLHTIERSARTQAALIDDLLDVSRCVTGKMVLETEPVELHSVIDAAIDTVRFSADARRVELAAEHSGQTLVVNGDPTRLQQVFWNLLSNAIKFSDPGEMVVISALRHVNHAVVIVRDRGKGIDPDLLPHIFEPFRQGDGSASRAYNGLGLGLALVKYLTESHGGTVHAESDGPGKGARFVVRLPLASVS